MNADEVLRLIDAGFSADEIRTMQAEKTPETNETGTKETGTDESKKNDPKSETVTANVDALTAEVAKLTETVKAMQEQNIKKANSGSGSVDDPVQKVIDGFLKEL